MELTDKLSEALPNLSSETPAILEGTSTTAACRGVMPPINLSVVWCSDPGFYSNIKLPLAQIDNEELNVPIEEN